MNAFKEEVISLMGSEESPHVALSEADLHKAAFVLYEQREYAQSAQIFTQLVLQDPFSTDYWRGLASAHQMCRTYDKALQAWSLAALLDPADASCPFHAAECLMAQGEFDEALKALAEALRLRPESVLEQKIIKLKALLHG